MLQTSWVNCGDRSISYCGSSCISVCLRKNQNFNLASSRVTKSRIDLEYTDSESCSHLGPRWGPYLLSRSALGSACYVGLGLPHPHAVCIALVSYVQVVPLGLSSLMLLILSQSPFKGMQAEIRRWFYFNFYLVMKWQNFTRTGFSYQAEIQMWKRLKSFKLCESDFQKSYCMLTHVKFFDSELKVP